MVLRIIFTVIIQHLLGIPWLQMVGGLLLFWIAVKLLMAEEPDDDSVASSANLWEAVKIVAIADVVMSLDNVLAIAAAAGGQIWLIMLGLLISIPLVIGSTLIMWLLTATPCWCGPARRCLAGSPANCSSPSRSSAYLIAAANSLGVAPKVLMHVVEGSAAVLVVLAGWVLTRTKARHTAKQGAE